jgi:hypothetical protein
MWGILVDGTDIQYVRGVERYEDGTLMTPVLHLIGTWDGHALTLTEPPQPAASETPLPEPCVQTASPEWSPNVPVRQLQVGNDQSTLEAHRIVVLETVTCGSTLGIGVAVAAPDTVRYLESDYGKVSVTGWLRPLPNGP